MNGAVVCSAGWLAGLRGHRAVGERHAVGRAIGLGLVAVLVVDRVVLGLAALDLVVMNIKRNDTFIMAACRFAVVY